MSMVFQQLFFQKHVPMISFPTDDDNCAGPKEQATLHVRNIWGRNEAAAATGQ